MSTIPDQRTVPVDPVDEQIEYPETDGRPMGETDLHQAWMWKIKQLLIHRYRGQQVYVASDLLLYYSQNVPAYYVVPDAFVVFDCSPDMRRIFKTWEEKRVPNVVFEVTSRSTRREDEVFKLKLYETIGVHEYFMYDPTADYLKPPLQGHRLCPDGYLPIPLQEGKLRSQSLGVELYLDDQDLVLIDFTTGQIQLTGEENAHRMWADELKLREREQQLREQETAKRLAAEARVRELEEELRRRDENP